MKPSPIAKFYASRNELREVHGPLTHDQAGSERSGLADAAHLCDAISAEILVSGRKGKERNGQAQVAKRCADAIWVLRDTIGVPEKDAHDVFDKAGAHRYQASELNHIAAGMKAASAMLCLTEQEIRLACGELTAQEMRTVKAVLEWRRAAIVRKAEGL